MIIQPTWLGQPWYPGGFPLKTDQITAGDRTIGQIYFDCIDAKGEYSQDDEETLKSYCVYYINAPIFDNELTQEVKQKDLMGMGITELIMELLDCGLDPF
jgi:hypothetical protein